MQLIKKNSLLAIVLILLIIGSTLYVSYKNTFLDNKTELAFHSQKPYLIEKLEYVDSFIVPDVATVDEFNTLLNYQPTAAIFSVQAIADSITQEANNSFNPDINHSLPLLAHWNSGDIGFNEGMTPDYVISLIEEGNHILPSWKLEPYWATQLPQSYYEASILRAKELNLPLTFIIDPLESTFIDDSYYFSLAPETNPNVVDTNLNVLAKISPFGADSLWSEIAQNHANNSMLQLIQQWYPNPPLIMFVDNKNTSKLTWNETNISKRYVDRYAANENDTFKRTLIGAQWIEKYRLLHEEFKSTLVSDTWKANTKFVSYNSMALNIGTSDTWHYDSTITNHYFSVWPQTVDATNIEYTTDGTIESLNDIVFNVNNLDFLLKEADKSNSDYTHQLSISDNNTFATLNEYRGFAQLALWLTRPNVIREFTNVSNDKTIIVPRYQTIVDSVELIHNETTLQKFWKDGKLVENTNTKIEQSINVPSIYADSSKWFLLDVDTNPVAPWTTSSDIPVYAIALETGTTPNREWLVYAQSPKGDLVNITVTIPNYMDVMVNSSQQGDFFNIKENQDPSVFEIKSSIDNIPDAFSFPDELGVMRYGLIESNITTISGINTPTTISISKGSYYRVNGGLYTDYNGTLKNGDTVQVRHVSSDFFNTNVSSTVTIGGVDGTFTSRTLDENLTVIGVVNVMDGYGVVGDGIADDSAAIQNAYNTAKAEGKNLYFPAGKYFCNTFYNAQAVRLIGEDKNTTIIKGLPNRTDLDRLHNLGGAENITFENYRIGDYAAPIHRIFKNSAFHVTVPSDIDLNSYYMMTTGTSDTRFGGDDEFMDCDFIFPKIYIALYVSNYNSISIRNCTFNGDPSHSIRLATANSKNPRITITGNTIDGGKTGIFIGSDRVAPIQGGLIEGNTIRNQREEGIGLDGLGNNPGLVPVIANGPITSVSNDENGRLVISMDQMVYMNSDKHASPSPVSLRDDWTNFYFSFGEGSGLEGTFVKIHSFNSIANTLTLDSPTSATDVNVGGDAGVQSGFFNWIIRGNTLSGILGDDILGYGYGTAISVYLNVFGTLVENNTVTNSAHGLNVAGGLMENVVRTLAYSNVVRNNTFLNCDTAEGTYDYGAVRFNSRYEGPPQYNNKFINNTIKNDANLPSARIFLQRQDNSSFIFEDNNLTNVSIEYDY